MTTWSKFGDAAHRRAYWLLAGLPVSLARFGRHLTFQTHFSRSDDPWRYATSDYERRKRDVLVSAVPAGAETIVEVGCAGGHNLLALARRHPASRVIGLDISGRAVQAARRLVASQPNVHVAQSDVVRAADVLRQLRVTRVDTLVLAEVLYYLGNPAQVMTELRRLRPMVTHDGHVVLLHPRPDAARLHGPALSALRAQRQLRLHVDDLVRPFVVDVGAVRLPRLPRPEPTGP